MKEALIIFVRNPVPGKVKTRLAYTMGNEMALAIYKKLLLHTHAITKELPVDKFVFYAEPFEADNFNIWTYEDGGFMIREQQGIDLGGRMKNAFERLFQKQYRKVCIIGSDCMALTATCIETAFAQLHHSEVVIGPSVDGGYYLLGMRQLHLPLFEDKAWSTAQVLRSTMADLQRMQLSYKLLPVLSDIDTEEDWINHQQQNNHHQ